MRGNPAIRFALLTLAFLSAGCQSSPVLSSQYVSPCVTGRVLDATTGQPLRNVSIRRVKPSQQVVSSTPRVGDESLERTRAVRTGPDGAFSLDSERDLTILRRDGWYSVSLAFTRQGYERLVTNYSLVNAVIAPSGEPVVNAGNILLQRTAKQRQNQ